MYCLTFPVTLCEHEHSENVARCSILGSYAIATMELRIELMKCTSKFTYFPILQDSIVYAISM
jgi:hypothetical protein